MKCKFGFLSTAGALILTAQAAFGAGHGPAFSLATPTLGEGQWSSDTSVMTIGTEEGTAFMFREWVGYGVTEDVQATLGFPLAPGVDELKLEDPPRTRGTAMMGGFDTVEPGVMWRFDKRYPEKGKRYESTLTLNAGIPTTDERGGVNVGPSVHAGISTGYASRTWYWWAGAGYERYFERGGDRLGDLPYLTGAVGYRPPIFQHDYPKPDIRVFLEGLAEFPQEDTIGGHDDPNSGGTRVMVGPSVLGLFGKTGVEAGVLFPVYQELNGQREEDYRATIDLVIWW